MEKILRVNDQTSGNALLIDTCNDFRKMNCPTLQPVTLYENGKLKYRSQGGLIGIYEEKVLDEIMEALEALRTHVRKYEASQKEVQKQVSKKASKKKEEASEEVDDKAMDKALQTLMSVGHTEAEARRILKLDQEDEGEDLPEDIRITLQVLLDKGVSQQEAYKKLGLTKAGKIDKRKKR